MKKLAILLILMVWGLAQGELKAQTLRWTSFADLNDSLRKERRPLLIFIHTDWCKYCKAMELKTFTEPLITNALNKNFYCLNLDAEDANALTFLNRKYKFKPSGVNTGVHELAQLLGTENGKLSYPTTVFFDQNLQLQTRIVGMIDAKKLRQAIESDTGLNNVTPER